MNWSLVLFGAVVVPVGVAQVVLAGWSERVHLSIEQLVISHDRDPRSSQRRRRKCTFTLIGSMMIATGVVLLCVAPFVG